MKFTKKAKLFITYILVAPLLLLASSCTTMEVNETLKSMNTDLDKASLTRSDYYKKLADNYFEQNQYQTSADHYRLALLHDGKNNSARFGLAQTYAALDQNEIALSEFNRFLAQSEDQINGATILTDKQLNVLTNFFEKSGSIERIYEINKDQFKKTHSNYSLWKMYELSLRMKKYDQAFEVLALLAANNNGAQKAPLHLLYLSKAEIYSLQKNYAQAFKELESAELESPFDEFFLRKKMQVLSHLNRWDEVILTGQKYIKYQTRHLLVSDLIINAAFKIEDYQLAIEELNWQAKLMIDSRQHQLKIAHLNFLLKKYDVAEKQYEELSDLYKYEDEIKYYLSLIYIQTNRLSQAQSLLAEIKETSSYFTDAQIKLAKIEYTSGEKILALNRLHHVHELKKSSVHFYKIYSEYLIENNNFLEAVALLEKGLESEASSEELHISLAFCHYKLRNFEMFKKELDRVISINPAHVKTYEMLTELWYNDNRKISDIEYFANLAMKLDTKNESLMKILGWVYIDQNKMSEAAILFEMLYDKNPTDFFYSEMLSKIYEAQNIHSKALEYANYARRTQNQTNIKEYLNDLLKNRSHQYENSIYSDQRRPASLGDLSP